MQSNTETALVSAPVSAPVVCKPKRIRRKPVAIDASSAPSLKACLASGQFVGIRAEKKDGTPRTYCAHKPYFRHLAGNRQAAELNGKTKRAKTEKEKAMIVFSEANLDGIRAISGESRVFRITHNGQTWLLNRSEYERQRAEFRKQEENPLENVVKDSLAQVLSEDSWPADISALFSA